MVFDKELRNGMWQEEAAVKMKRRLTYADNGKMVSRKEGTGPQS